MKVTVTLDVTLYDGETSEPYAKADAAKIIKRWLTDILVDRYGHHADAGKGTIAKTANVKVQSTPTVDDVLGGTL